jgi:hypothetical protein
MMKFGFIITVGTTLLRNYTKWFIGNNLGSEEEALNNFYNKKLGDDFIDYIISSLKVHPPVYLSAEMQTIGLFFSEDGPEDRYKDCSKILTLIPVKKRESEICAELIKQMLVNPRISLPLMGGVKVARQMSAIDFQFENRREFSLQVSQLVAQISKISDQYRQANCERIVLCISSGYKALIPYITLFGFIDGSEVVYAHFTSRSVVSISSMPLAWDLRLLDEQRIWAMIDAIPDTTYASLPAKFKVLHDSDPVTINGQSYYQKSAFGQLISHAYRKDRRDRFGWGEAFLLNIPESYSYLRDNISSLIKTKWEYLWIGDQIPETVEHTRGHSCRLIELARDLLRLTSLDLSGPELYCLIAAIWLHDIGHTALISGALTKGENHFPLYLFPSLVREFHNVLSSELIEAEQDLDKDLKPVVVALSTYHRNKMPLYEGQDSFKREPFSIEVKPLEETNLTGTDIGINRVMLLAALLRFLDGCDVQADRIIDQNYKKAREKRTNNEIAIYGDRLEQLIKSLDEKDSLYKELDNCKDELNKQLESWGNGESKKKSRKALKQFIQEKAYTIFESGQNASHLEILGLIDSILFKREQEEHFLKHGGIECVYLGSSDIKECGQQQGDFKPAIGVYILVKGPIDNNPQLVSQFVNVAEDIWDEYTAVKKTLDNYFWVTGIYLTDGSNVRVLIPQPA